MAATRVRDLTVGALVVVACIVQFATMGRAVSLLAVALLLAFVIWRSATDWRRTPAVVTAYAIAVLVQCAHVIEEYRTAFYAVFPQVFGAQPWSPQRFLTFNIIWLVVFGIAGVGIVAGQRLAYLVALFLALGGGIGNGIGHIGLAMQRDGYFPGLYTGSIALFAGGALLYALLLSGKQADSTFA